MRSFFHKVKIEEVDRFVAGLSSVGKTPLSDDFSPLAAGFISITNDDRAVRSMVVNNTPPAPTAPRLLHPADRPELGVCERLFGS